MQARLWAAAVLAFGLSLASAPSASAPVQWTIASGGNGHFYDIVYQVTGGGFTWDSAFADAPTRANVGMTGYVATVTSAAEQAFLAANFPQVLAWLGGTDRETEGTWKWMNGPESGLDFTYLNWSPDEPNDANSGEDQLVMNWNGAGLWNDMGAPQNPNFAAPYIIEFDAPQTTIPEAATLALVALGLTALGFTRRRRQQAA